MTADNRILTAVPGATNLFLMGMTGEHNSSAQGSPAGEHARVAAEAVSASTRPTALNRETSGLFRFSVTQFLLALILLLLITLSLPEVHGGDLILDGMMSLLLISAVLAVGGGRQSLALTISLVLPALAAQWVDRYQPGRVPQWLITAVGLVFISFVIVQLLRFILRAPRVNADVLCAGLSVYLLLGLLWAAGYLLLARLGPDSFKLLYGAAEPPEFDRFKALYFSFVSLTCLGCNDIVPVSRPARMLMVVESTVGVLYLAVMIARLVALYSRPSPGGRR